VGGAGGTPAQSWPTMRREDRLVVASRKALGNAPGSTRVKVPWPSFNKIATGWLSQVVVRTRSRLRSPLTSRAEIRMPPERAKTGMDCRPAALSCSSIQYCVPENPAVPVCTPTRSGGALNFAIRGRSAGKKRDEKQREQPAQAAGEREIAAAAGEAFGLGIRLRHNLVGPGKR